MLYCNEHHQLILSSVVENTSLSKPQLTNVSATLSPNISMSSLNTVSTSNSTTTNALKHVIYSKKNSLYTPHRNDIFDRIDLSQFSDTFSISNSISTCSIPSLEFDSIPEKCLQIYYNIDLHQHPLYQDPSIQQFNQLNTHNYTHTKQIKKSVSLINYIKAKIINDDLDINEILFKINYNQSTIIESKQLQTFNTQLKPIDIFDDSSSLSTSVFFKPRECRLNTSFLKFFAIYKSVSENSITNINIDFYYNKFINSQYTSIDEFLYRFNITDPEIKSLLKFHISSREKLYTNIILPARKDMFSKNHLTNKINYYKVEPTSQIENGSLIRSNGKPMPWYNFKNLNNKKSFPPIGVLPNNTQYTVKNWENKRWSSL